MPSDSEVIAKNSTITGGDLEKDLSTRFGGKCHLGVRKLQPATTELESGSDNNVHQLGFDRITSINSIQ